jgi:curved DNA-binding protein CbpA
LNNMTAAPDLGADDFYARLGVSRADSAEEIKRAYLQLVRRYTPERAPDSFKRIREAYETLSSPASRAQYDQRPAPHLEALLEQASHAMKRQDYAAATLAYKRVLLEAPDLHWVRNLLGLCFLYRAEPNDAIAQYERLLRSTSEDPSIYGNAGHAYRLGKRFPEAESAFRTAMRLAGKDATEYGLGLIQAWVDQGKFEEADKFAASQASAAGAGSTAAAEFTCKRIELVLLLGKKAKVSMLVEQLARSVSSDEERWHSAFALGRAATKLIAGEVFASAEIVAKGAKRLQPTDPDYDAQEQASQLLYKNDFDGVARLLNTHVSFAPNGWLHGLKPVIQEYCAKHAAFNGIRPIEAPPTLYRINGVGTTIHGNRDADPSTGTHVVTQYFTFLFVPLFPIASYRVRPAPTGGWYFLGKVPYARAQKAHWAVFLVLVTAWIVTSLVEQLPAYASFSGVGTGSASMAVGGTRPLSDFTAEPDPDSIAESERPPLAVYEGQVINKTSSASPIRGAIRLTFHAWDGPPYGYLRVFRPLGGSGPILLATRGDSIRLATISAAGDTIVWLGERLGDMVLGDYAIVGGQYKAQHGTWSVSRKSGATIPRRLNPW